MESIKLEPNFVALFKMFSREAKLQAGNQCREGSKATLEGIKAVLAPLSVAAQAITSTDDVQTFRDTIADVVELLAKRITELDEAESEADDARWQAAIYVRDTMAREFGKDSE